ncbi:MAG: hypothetical protein OXI13_00555, partial [Gammaproteobacteria bacterium]|nr:hypothetical protein [Gammaproteobacteria bacterium]
NPFLLRRLNSLNIRLNLLPFHCLSRRREALPRPELDKQFTVLRLPVPASRQAPVAGAGNRIETAVSC